MKVYKDNNEELYENEKKQIKNLFIKYADDLKEGSIKRLVEEALKEADYEYYPPYSPITQLLINNNENIIRTLDNDVKYIPKYFFYHAVFDPGKVTFNNITNIKYGAFMASRIREIDIPGSVQYIDKLAFYECRGLETVNISDGVKDIRRSAFEHCHSLHDINLPSHMDSIGEEAFKDCTSLRKVKIPDGVTSLEHRLFANCKYLEELYVPESVTKFDEEVFNDYMEDLVIVCHKGSAADRWANRCYYIYNVRYV